MSRHHRAETPEESKTPPDINHLYSIKVDNLSYRTTLAVVESYFKKFGKLGDIYVPRDRDTHESRGFAFIRFFEERDAEDAMDSMDGKMIDGRQIRCAMARYGRPANSSSQDSGRRRRGFRSFYKEGRASFGRGGGGRGANNRSRSRSRDRGGRRSRSRSRSPPRYHRRSPSRSPQFNQRRRSFSRSPFRASNRSPDHRRGASPPYRRSRSRSR